LVMGLFQALAIIPGISRSGMSISSGLFLGLPREKAAKFSFLMFIPITIGAGLLEFLEVGSEISITLPIVISFIICFFLSLIFLNLIVKILEKGYFWMFGFYCLAVGIFSIVIYFF